MKNYERKIYVIVMTIEIAVFILVGAVAFVRYRASSAEKEKIAEETTKVVQETTTQSTEKSESTEAEETEDDQVTQKLAEMTLEEKVAQLFILSPEALTGADLVERSGEQTKQSIENYPVGGLFYVSANMGSESQVQDMLSGVQQYSQDRIGLPLFLGIQEEGGSISPFAGNTSFELSVESAAELAESKNAQDDTYQAGKTIGSYMSQLGFNFNVGPVSDIAKTSNALTVSRSFGSDEETVASLVSAQVKGMKEEGVMSVLKYFPGKGNVSGDSDSTYATTDMTLEELRNTDLKVYESGIEAGADCIMVGHIVAPNLAGEEVVSSLSKKVVTDILRNELNYDGLVMTEALNAESIVRDYTSAEAAVALLQAGGDLIFMPEDFEAAYNGVLAAVDDGTLTEKRIDESVKRILRVKLADN